MSFLDRVRGNDSGSSGGWSGAPGSSGVLGVLRAPSGVLVLGDFGLLGWWSGDHPPGAAASIGTSVARVGGAPGSGLENLWEQTPNRIEDSARDLRIEGPDAEAAARLLERQTFTYLYDVSCDTLDTLQRDFNGLVREAGLSATLVEEPYRIPHHERARRAARAGGGEFLTAGVRNIAIEVDPHGQWQVLGHVSPEGTWTRVEIILAGGHVSERRVLGWVDVECARLLYGDARALGSWAHERSLDGLADVVFAGIDQAEALSMLGGNELADGSAGWLGLPEMAARELTEKVREWRSVAGRSLVVDLRVHSHQHYLMEQIRASEPGHGLVVVEDIPMVGFHSSVGDGIFPVWGDLDPIGQIKRVWVDLTGTWQ